MFIKKFNKNKITINYLKTIINCLKIYLISIISIFTYKYLISSIKYKKQFRKIIVFFLNHNLFE